MNNQLRQFARKTLIEGLSELTPGNHRIFRLMYGRLNGKRSVEDAMIVPLEDIIGEMEDAKLDWAMQQVSNTIAKNAKKENPQTSQESL